MNELWIHAVGAYLIMGSLISGLGLLARARWQGETKSFFRTRKDRIAFGLGIFIGVFFWPILLIGIGAARKYFLRRQVNKILGYCEHADAFRPFCEACGREMKYETSGKRTPEEAERMYREVSRKLMEHGETQFISAYECSSCKILFDGFPKAATPAGKPLCEKCLKEGPNG